jgi:hypothetical protein
MDPVQPPHEIRREMDRGRVPIVVDVVAHDFDQFRDQMRADRNVTTALDGHARRTPQSGVSADAHQGLAMKRKYRGRTELKWAPDRIDGSFDYADAEIVLTEAVLGLRLSFELRIGNEVRL